MDCGEGVQFQSLRFGLNIQKLDYIFVSHLHGDHVFGLIGLISTLSMWDRRKKLKIYSPHGLKKTIDAQLDYNKAPLNYELDFVELDTTESHKIIDNDHFEVVTVPLEHGIACMGYVVKEKPRPRNLIKEYLHEGMKISHIRTLKRGEDVVDHVGKVIYKNEDFTLPESPIYSYAYLSDTKYLETVVPIIEGVSVLYHEATFLEEHRSRADTTYHSTVMDAAMIAKLAKVDKLIIGHFSSRYESLEKFIEEGERNFEAIELAFDGKKIVLRAQ